MKFHSFRFKINTAILLTCIVIALFFSAIFYPFEVNRRQSRLERIQLLLNTIFEQKKEELANEIFADQKDALARSLKDVQSLKDISEVSIYGIDGRLVLSTNDKLTAPLSPSEKKALKQAPLVNIINKTDLSFVEYSSMIEIIGERVGYFKIHFDLSEMEKESFSYILFFSLLMFSILLITAFLLNLLLSRSLIQPASKLRDGIRKVKLGQFGEQVNISSMDEIGEIADDFNEMSTKLKEQHAELISAIEEKDSYAYKIKKTNEKLEDLNNRLEDMVVERTNALRTSYEKLKLEIQERQRTDKENRDLEERLARSQKMEALGLLAGGVAHDLNNVLSGIVSYPDLILMDLDEQSPLKQSIATIKDSGQKAAAIVQDLLTLARRGVTNTEVLNFNDDIIHEYLRSPEHEKLKTYYPHIHIDTHLEPDLMNIKGSPVHLRKTLMNLVSNAAEAQPSGGKVAIYTRNQYVDRPIRGYDHVQEGDYIVLKIEDNGGGIAPDDLNKIFEPFYTKKIMGRSGTGLGMAVVWGTVQDHHGYIHVESSEGKGTTIELYFPITREGIKKEDALVPIEDYKGNGELILVVDDVKEQREIATHILTKLGYSVTCVSSGMEAIEYIKQNIVDMLVLDMIMDPGIDGLDTYKEIIKISSGQKAIIASGFAENERVREAQRLGAGQYIKKPYTLEKIGLAIKRELSR
ncbi:MAG: ATP-binding protein [Thermodesulfobacteriota bacterium]|nr:ATP-binding protein [Thermodesulfobacteriota bacterium]